MPKIRIGQTDFSLVRKIKEVEGREYVRVDGHEHLVKRDDFGKPYIEWTGETPPEGATTPRIVVM